MHALKALSLIVIAILLVPIFSVSMIQVKVEGDSELEVLASGLDVPEGILVHNDFVYWTERQDRSGQGGRIGKVLSGGGTVSTFAAISNPTYKIVTDGTFIYASTEMLAPGYIKKIRISDSFITDLVSSTSPWANYIYALTLLGEKVYWSSSTHAGVTGGIWSVSKDGGSIQELTRLHYHSMIDTSPGESWIYAVERDNTVRAGDVVKVPASGGAIEVLYDSITPLGAGFPDVADGYVYWPALEEGKICRIPTAGGPREILAEGEDHPYSVLVDGDYVYWAADTSISRVLIDRSGPVELLVDSLVGPKFLAISNGYLYWSEFGWLGSSPPDPNIGTIKRIPLIEVMPNIQISTPTFRNNLRQETLNDYLSNPLLGMVPQNDPWMDVTIYVEAHPSSLIQKVELKTSGTIPDTHEMTLMSDDSYAVRLYEFDLNKIIDFLLFLYPAPYGGSGPFAPPITWESPRIKEILVTDVLSNVYKKDFDIVLPTIADLDRVSPFGTIIDVASPIDVLVTDSQDQRVGAIYQNGTFLEIAREIPNASYIRPTPTGPKLVYLPFSNESYGIQVFGNASGSFKIAIITVIDPKTEKDVDYQTGEIQQGQTVEYSATITTTGEVSFTEEGGFPHQLWIVGSAITVALISGISIFFIKYRRRTSTERTRAHVRQHLLPSSRRGLENLILCINFPCTFDPFTQFFSMYSSVHSG